MSLLPLDTFFSIMGFNHWHAFGFSDNDKLAVTSSCNPILFELSGQGYDAIGRADIRQALEDAESQFSSYLSFKVAPEFYEMEVQWSRLPDRRMDRYGPWDSDGRWRNIRLQDSWIHDCGVEGLTLIQENAPVVLVDVDGDGYYDYFQIGPIPTTFTDVKEIACYFTGTDRWDETDVGETWRVEPLRVSISGGQLTIRGAPWLIGRPVLSIGIEPQPLNPTDPDSFASGLDVYRRFVNNAGISTDDSQAVIMWETQPWGCGCASSVASQGSILDPRGVAQATGRVGIRDGRRGIVTPAEALYNATTGLWSGSYAGECREPDRVLLRLHAGFPLDPDGQMNRRLRTGVARLTAAELPQDICGCAEATRRLFHWQGDLSKVGADKQLFAISSKQLDCPLGTRRGQIAAWNLIEDMARVSGRRI